LKTFAWPQVVTCYVCPGGARAVPAGSTVEDATAAHQATPEHQVNAEVIAACGMYQCAGKPGPSHWASPLCRSGRRNHCTCDGCF
jgi:hypothetical protein